MQSLPLLADSVATVSVNEKRQKDRKREREKPRVGNVRRRDKYEPVWDTPSAHPGSINFPDTHKQAHEIPRQVVA